MLRLVTFKVEEELLEKVDKLAKFYGCNRSEVIRKALETYVKLVENTHSQVELRPARIERLRIW